MKTLLMSLALTVSLLLGATSGTFAKECMNKTKLEETIKENLNPTTEIYATLVGPEVQTFLQALETLHPGITANAPDMDTIHVVPDGMVAIIVAMKDGCVKGAARMPAELFFAARQLYRTAN